MGIENFHKWLKGTYPSCIVSYYHKNTFDYIYIDVNYLLHNSVYNCRSESEFVKKLYMYLDIILCNFIPTKKVVLAVDGPSPYSKVILQRKRRMVTHGPPDTSSRSGTIQGTINPLHLTPGTDLMHRMDNYLKTYVNHIKKKYLFVNPEFVVSSASIPDEGEIKIFKNLIEYGNEYPNASHLVVGNDADLVVLGMAALPIYNLFLLVKNKETSDVISIQKLIELHHSYVMGSGPKHESIDFLKYDSIRTDFSLISIMMGNDYLPKLNYVKFELLWDCYKQLRIKKGVRHHLIENDQFHIQTLQSFFQTIITNLKKQYRSFDFQLYDPRKVKHYLEGLLWCVSMYETGKCPMYDFMYSSSATSPAEILYFLETNEETIKVPTSNIAPLPLDVCTVLLIPKQAKYLIPKRLEELVESKLQFLYTGTQCKKCQGFKSELSVYHKQLRVLQKQDLDSEEVRKAIGSVSSSLHHHKKDHTDEQEFTIKDIRKVITIMGRRDKDISL